VTVTPVRESTRRLLGYRETHAALAAVGAPVVRQQVFRTPAEAAAFANEIGGAVALKLSSPDLVHKSDVGAVRLGLEGAPAVAAAATELAALAAQLGLGEWELLVQEQIEAAGFELLVGVTTDPVFGPIVVVGPGGRFVELLRETSIRRCPVTLEDAVLMLGETSLAQALEGFRGDAAWDVPAVAALIAGISTLPELVEGLAELDLNPVLIDRSGSPVVVDARIIVDDGSTPNGAARSLRPVDALFAAESVVVVGASAGHANKPGNRVLRYLRKHGFEGAVHVLHPSATSIEGFPAVPSVEQLPMIELACLAVPADACEQLLRDLSTRGVRAAVVFSSGFSDAGNDAVERDLAAAADELSIALAGPNTVGVIDVGRRLHLTFSQAEELDGFRRGNIAIVAQSGALGGSLLTQAWSQGLGISAFASVGNQAFLGVPDYLSYFARDHDTEVVALLLEGAEDGDQLLAALDELGDAGTSTVVLKLGDSSVGAAAVRSHTGSVAGDAEVYRALLRQHGAIVVDSLTALLDAASVVSTVGKPAGPRVGVLSTSGGGCALIADACARYGLHVPQLGERVQAALEDVLPAFATTRNPIDVTGQVSTDPALYTRALRVVLQTAEVDSVILMLTTIGDPQAAEIAEQIVPLITASEMPVVVSWTIAPELAPRGLAILREAAIPVFTDPLRAAAALSAVVDSLGYSR
jgi:acyl-CoA synthetase (NDP forming)